MPPLKHHIDKLTGQNIRPYGIIIDSRHLKKESGGNVFGVLLKENSRGWRIGYLIVREKSFKRLEKHPDSFETFEPVKGLAAIALASGKAPYAVKEFLLDKPLVVKKGIWHDVRALSKEAEIKIFENIDVRTEYRDLPRKITR